MPPETPNGSQHLPDLSIKGFRGIDDLSIPRLGRVTLLAGRNGVGKTTVLEAVRVYAARGRPAILRGVLYNHEEITTFFDEDDKEILSPDITALFYGREVSRGSSILIGPKDRENCLGIEASTLDELSDEQKRLFTDVFVDSETEALKISFQNSRRLLPWKLPLDGPWNIPPRRMHRRLLDEDNEWPSATRCESLGPGLPGNNDMVRFWDRIALTDDENLSIQALRLILGDDVEKVAVIGDEGRAGRARRRVIVKLSGESGPVPLKSLGDGAIRLFGVALALANSRDGFLVIDEAENGIHHSVQCDFWRMVLQIAHENNVQVLATTHSWDCVKGFARAAEEARDIEGVLVRLERDDERLRAIAYSESELATAAEQGIEVR